MSKITVVFTYHTRVDGNLFRNVRLVGSWSAQGGYSEEWTTTSMEQLPPSKTGNTFSATIQLDDAEAGKQFYWGIVLNTHSHADQWGIMTESPLEEGGIPRAVHAEFPIPLERCRRFTLPAPNGAEQAPPLLQTYRLSHCRGMGSAKCPKEAGEVAGICFSTWAPNAQKVELVTASSDSGGYIWNDGRGVQAAYAMERSSEGLWSTQPDESQT